MRSTLVHKKTRRHLQKSQLRIERKRSKVQKMHPKKIFPLIFSPKPFHVRPRPPSSPRSRQAATSRRLLPYLPGHEPLISTRFPIWMAQDQQRLGGLALVQHAPDVRLGLLDHGLECGYTGRLRRIPTSRTNARSNFSLLRSDHSKILRPSKPDAHLSRLQSPFLTGPSLPRSSLRPSRMRSPRPSRLASVALARPIRSRAAIPRAKVRPKHGII